MKVQSTTARKGTTATRTRVQTRTRSRQNLEELTPAARCRQRFLRYFPERFRDQTYLEWERDYKEEAHSRWDVELGSQFGASLRAQRFSDVANRAIRIESGTNLLFSFEKMALRNAVRTALGSRMFSRGLYDFLHGRGSMATRFDRWCAVVGSLPRRQTRVLNVACCDGVWLYRTTRPSHVSQAECHSRRCGTVRCRLSLPVSAELEHLQ